MKPSDETILNVAVAGVAFLALVVQAVAHLLTPATPAAVAGLAPVDGTAHDLLIGCIGFLARNVVRGPSAAA